MQQFSFDARLTTVEQCPCLALSVGMTEERNYQKQNNLQPSAHIMHTTCHHPISAHSSQAAPPSTTHSSNITSDHLPVKPQLQ